MYNKARNNTWGDLGVGVFCEIVSKVNNGTVNE